MMERCKKCVSLLPVRLVEQSMLLSHAGKLSTIPRDRVCLQLVKEEYYYLVNCDLLRHVGFLFVV